MIAEDNLALLKAKEMYYQEYRSNKELRPFIRSYFHVHLDSDTEFRFPSDACPGLIINLGDPFLLGFAENTLTVFSGCRFFGYFSQQLIIKSLSATEVLAVKFQTGQLTNFSTLPGIELSDTCVAIEQLWGAMGRELENRIYETHSIPEIIKLLDAFFLKCLSLHRPIDGRIDAALNAIVKRKGQIRIDELAKWTNLSRRQFERRFTNAIGLSPKRMCRIARIAGIIPHLKSNTTHGWSNVALSAGYSDQAHFIREWKYFSGSTPLTYLKDLLPIESAVVGLQ